MTEETKPVTTQPGRTVIRTYSEMEQAAEKIIKAKLAPRGMDTPEAVFIAMETGMEAGLHPMAALRSVVVIGNIPSWKGDAALALIRSSGRLKKGSAISIGTRGNTEKDLEGFVQTHRQGEAEPCESVFTVNDAKRAGLWDKAGPWKQYPKVMLTWRAVAMHAKRYWSDVLMGLALAEEVQDYEIIETPAASTRPELPPTTGPDPLLASTVGGGAKAETAAPPEGAPTQPKAGKSEDPLPLPEEPPHETEEPPHETPVVPLKPGERLEDGDKRASEFKYDPVTGDLTKDGEPITEPEPCDEPDCTLYLGHEGAHVGPEPTTCPGCQRHGNILKESGHREDCAFKGVGNRLPTLEEIRSVME